MSRAVVSTLLFAGLVACDVGEIPIGGVGGDGGGGGPDGNTAALCADRGQIGVAHLHAGNLTHAGEGCITVGCHLTGQLGVGAPAYTAAGTVYKADGTTPNGGAAVRVVTGGMTLKGFADDAGNFFISGPITFPAQTNASACPDTTPMAGAIVAGGGNCNGGTACHQAAGAIQGVIKFQ